MLFYVYVLNDTAPSAVELLNHSRNANAVTISWAPARSLLDGYVVSISSESLMKEEILPSTKRYENIKKIKTYHVKLHETQN